VWRPNSANTGLKLAARSTGHAGNILVGFFFFALWIQCWLSVPHACFYIGVENFWDIEKFLKSSLNWCARLFWLNFVMLFLWGGICHTRPLIVVVVTI